jgi:MFS family permease
MTTDGEVAFRWRPIVLPAYGPSLIGSIGTGAVSPLLALVARDLGASVPVAALLVAVPIIAELLVALPVGVLIDRAGERLALTLGGALEAIIGILGWSAGSLWMLVVAAVLIGPTSAVFVVARQSFLAQVVPVDQRARAMSSLGGVARIGWFIGPLLAAPLIATHGAKASFLVLAGAGVAAAALTWWSMDLPDLVPGATTGNPVPVPVSQTVRRHLRIFLTVGIGVLIIGLARSARLTVVPLWSEHVGLSASQVSLLFSLSYGLEMLLFFPAGWVMDRFGRVWVAVPVAVVLGAALLLLPLATTLTGVAVAALAMGLANGMGSGIVMTLGADLAPADGRAAFLGVWRWLSLIGTNSAALIVAGIAAAVGLGAASVVVGALSLLGGGWLWRWVPAHDPRRQRQT